MSLQANAQGVVDYVVARLIAAWPGVNVSHEPAEIVNTPPFALVTVSGLEYAMEGSTLGSDAYALTIQIGARFAKVANLTANKIQRIHDARIQLLSSNNVGGFGFQPMVMNATLEDEDVQDGFYEVGMTFTCLVNAPRA